MVENQKYNEKPSLQALADELRRQKHNRYDVIAPSDGLIVFKDGSNIKMDVPQLDGTIKQHGITNFCHGQIANKTGIPKAYYDKMFEGDKLDLLADNINAWMPKREKRLVRVLDGKVRALLSNRYRVMDNYNVLCEAIEEFQRIEKQRGLRFEIKEQNLTEKHMYVKVTSPDLTGDVFHLKDRIEPVQGGIIISNSEVGAGSFNVKPFINILVCQNGLISDKIIKKIHIGRERDVGLVDWSDKTLKLEDEMLWSKVRDMIQATFDPEVFNKWVDEINGIAQIEVPRPTLAVDNIIKHYDIPKTKRDELLDQFIKESHTQWGLAMAVTQVAQNEADYEKQINLEKVGAELLNKKATPIVTVEVEDD